MRKKLSIITVNYNNFAGLQRTVESVVNQTWQEFEYIVIDGGSIDGSTEYIESLSEKLDYWVCEPDKGIYNAMNKGILKSRGDYLLFLNSGDWLADKIVIEEVIPRLNEVDVVYGNLIKVYNDGNIALDKGCGGKPISLKTFVFGTLNHSASFIKRELFEKHGLYDEKLKIVSDWKLYLLALGLNSGTTIYVDRSISYFDMTGISNQNLKLRNEERQIVLRELVPMSILNDIERLHFFENFEIQKEFNFFISLAQSPKLRKINWAWIKFLNAFRGFKIRNT